MHGKMYEKKVAEQLKRPFPRRESQSHLAFG